MWMHFFWVFGHPEVYVLVIPAFAFASEIIPVFSRKAIFGYPVMVAATICIGFIGMSVWAHHMFTVGMSSSANTFFVLSTMAIAVPTGIKIFNWLATMWGGQIHFKTPMLFCVAFLFQFLISGLTGVMLSSAPFNWQLGNSYFVIAHFHYVIVGGILFNVFGAFYYWFPKMSGTNVQRDTRQTALLALHRRIPSNLRFHAYPRHSWDASPNLYLRAGARLGHLESH
jgi:heme/copper-type cytochrome/quinol oxidase subunit 1